MLPHACSVHDAVNTSCLRQYLTSNSLRKLERVLRTPRQPSGCRAPRPSHNLVLVRAPAPSRIRTPSSEWHRLRAARTKHCFAAHHHAASTALLALAPRVSSCTGPAPQAHRGIKPPAYRHGRRAARPSYTQPARCLNQRFICAVRTSFGPSRASCLPKGRAFAHVVCLADAPAYRRAYHG